MHTTRHGILLLASSLLLVSCNRGEEPGSAAGHRPALGAPAPEGALPEGHPDIGAGTELPEGHPEIGGPHAEAELPEGHPDIGGPHAGMELPEGHPEPGGGAGGAPAMEPNRAGGLVWTVPQVFEARGAHSRMRLARFVVPGGGQGEEASLTVFYFGEGQGGEVQANVDRWLGQVRPEDGRPAREAARIGRRTVNGVSVTTVDVAGSYAAVGPMGGATDSRPGQRLLGAIAEGPEGPVFFKLVGPVETVARVEGEFRRLVGSIRAPG